jgi:ankyrin repeat protein
MAFHLIRYAGEGDVRKVKKWIDYGVHIDASNVRKETALFVSSIHGHVKCVEFLLSRGADPNKLVLFACSLACLLFCMLFVFLFARLFICLFVYLSLCMLFVLVCLSDILLFISGHLC